MSFTLDRETVDRAIMEEVTLWYIEQRNALQDFKMGALEDEDDFTKTYAWLNFGIDASKTLFPASYVGRLVSSARATIPLWVIGQAQSAFVNLYGAYINHHRKKLKKKYDRLRSEFIDEMQTIHRNFINEPYGRSINDGIRQHWQNKTFRDSSEAETLCRELIHHAGLIVTDSDVIKQRTESRFGGLCSKVCKIYLGMDDGPGVNDLYYASPQQVLVRTASGGGRVTHQWQHVRRENDQYWILANAWRMRNVRHIDEWFGSKQNDRTFVIDTGVTTPSRLSATFRGGDFDFAAAERRMNRARSSR
jgi:hypothetical protein